jgi:Fe-S-cluster containining protein
MREIPGRCGGCTGRCCTGDAIVDVTGEDVARLAQHTGRAAASFLVPPGPGKAAWAGTLAMVPIEDVAGGRGCVFLALEGGAGRCSVYEARPAICREFSAEACTIFVPLRRGKAFTPAS